MTPRDEGVKKPPTNEILGVSIPPRGAIPHSVPERLADKLRAMIEGSTSPVEALAQALKQKGVTLDQVGKLQDIMSSFAQRGDKFADLHKLPQLLSEVHCHLAGPKRLDSSLLELRRSSPIIRPPEGRRRKEPKRFPPGDDRSKG